MIKHWHQEKAWEVHYFRGIYKQFGGGGGGGILEHVLAIALENEKARQDMHDI